MTGHAGDWAQSVAEKAVNNNPVDFGTWDDFVRAMDHRFKDHAHQYKARQQAEAYKQGPTHVDEFVQELERLFRDASLIDEAEQTRLLTHNARRDIVERIYTSSDANPADYAGWKAKILMLGRFDEMYKSEFRNINPSSSSSSTTHHYTPRPPPPPSNTPQKPYVFNVNVPERKDATGITYGGAGQPMEIGQVKNVRCFGCGKLGHIRPDCPDGENRKKINIRELILQFTDEERDDLFLHARADELQQSEGGEDNNNDVKNFQ